MNTSIAQNSAAIFAQSMIVKSDAKPVRIKAKQIESNASIRNRIEAAKDAVTQDLDNNIAAELIAEKYNVSLTTIYASMRRWEYKRAAPERSTTCVAVLVKNIRKGNITKPVTVTVYGKVVGTFTPLENDNDNN